MLPQELATDLADEALAWQVMLALLEDDPDLRARVLQVFNDEPNVDDRYPVPLNPPEEWFTAQADVPASLKVTVGPTGHILGRFFEWGECVVGVSAPGDCWTPPPSLNGYENFHQSDVQVLTAQGGLKLIDVGMLVPGHSPPDSSMEASIEHYNDPTKGRALVRAYEDEHGAYITGSLVPWATYGDAALVSGSALSGHWVWREQMATVHGEVVSGFDCIGPSMVVRPGLPLKRRVYTPTGEAHPIAAHAVPDQHGCGDRRAYIGTFEEIMTQTQTAAPAKGTYSKPPRSPRTIVVAGTTYVAAHCAGGCGHCTQCRSLANQTAAMFDPSNELHVNVLDVLVGEFGAEVVINDITGSDTEGTVQFTYEGEEHLGNYSVNEDGQLSIVEAPGEDGPEALEEAEAAAAVMATLAPEMGSRIEMLEMGLEAANDRIRVLDSIIAQREMAEINADELTLE